MVRSAPAAVALALVLAAASPVAAQDATPTPLPTPTPTPPPMTAEPPQPLADSEPETVTPVHWRRSRALGLPWAGSLVRGVELPASGRDYFTWDYPLRRSPSRSWRRWGTDRLVRTVLDVIGEYRLAHPDAPRVGIGDLSRPRGGIFDRRFGGLGHASHQNGLDADVYYPRRDRRERAPDSPTQIDRRLARDLVARFVASDAEVVFVGPRTGLGPRGSTVQVLVHHDNHLHVRLSAVQR